MDKYLYFRSVTAVGDDDGSDASMMVPVANFKGAHPTDDDSIQLTFTSLYNAFDGNSAIVSDYVKLTTGTNKAKEAMQDLVEAINAHPNMDPFIVVGDDNASSYIGNGNITAVGAITIAAALS